MTDFNTPAGFVQAVAEIKAAERPMRLYFHPRLYHCWALPLARSRPTGSVKAGTFDAAELGDRLVPMMRLQLGLAIESAGVSRETSNLSEKSMAYYKAQGNAGRRSV